MFVLGIETATPWGSIALWEDGETLCEMSLKAQKGGGEFLLATLADWLPMIGKQFSELDLVAVGNGPGSYTGIRVGMAMANGLAEGLRIPVRGINTLRVIAENASCIPEEGSACFGEKNSTDIPNVEEVAGFEWVAAVIDARRGEVYAGLFRKTATGLEEVIPPQSITAAGLAQQLAGRSRVLLCGDGSKKYQDIWSSSPNLTIAPRDWDRPRAIRLARLAAQMFAAQITTASHTDSMSLQGRDPSDPKMLNDRDLKPAYLKKVEAEVRWEEKCK